MPTSDEIEVKRSREYIEEILLEAAESSAGELLVRYEQPRVQTYSLIDGKYVKGKDLPIKDWNSFFYLLRYSYFDKDKYQIRGKEALYTFGWKDGMENVIRITISRSPLPQPKFDKIEDIFSEFEDQRWGAVKSIFLSILNLALEQNFNEIVMELHGETVEINYTRKNGQRTPMVISSDTYDALSRLIGEKYLAFGFMTTKFRDKEYLIRLAELNEDIVAPRIRLEIEELLPQE